MYLRHTISHARLLINYTRVPSKVYSTRTSTHWCTRACVRACVLVYDVVCLCAARVMCAPHHNRIGCVHARTSHQAPPASQQPASQQASKPASKPATVHCTFIHLEFSVVKTAHILTHGRSHSFTRTPGTERTIAHTCNTAGARARARALGQRTVHAHGGGGGGGQRWRCWSGRAGWLRARTRCKRSGGGAGGKGVACVHRNGRERACARVRVRAAA